MLRGELLAGRSEVLAGIVGHAIQATSDRVHVCRRVPTLCQLCGVIAESWHTATPTRHAIRRSFGRMLARVATFAIDGVDPRLVWVEVDIRPGLPAFTIVGLGDAAVRESRERVRVGDPELGLRVPAAADHREPRAGLPAQGGPRLRRGARARGARRQRPGAGRRAGRATRSSASSRSAASCATRPGALAVAEGARRAGLERLIVPRERAREAALVDGLEVAGVGEPAGRRPRSCRRVARRRRCRPRDPTAPPAEDRTWPTCAATRCRCSRSQIAAAGGHNLLLEGAPGHGQDDARAAAAVDPAADDARAEAVEVDADPQRRRDPRRRADRARGRSGRRTTRSRRPGLVGGGAPPRPGEATLANHGVLFLDELSEFQRPSLEALRQPLEDGRVTIVRGQRALVLPDAVHARGRDQSVPVRVRRGRGPVPLRRGRSAPPPRG